ncbi:MAG: 2-C-methyl-D-erythritol 4-phosphate cytidylyltransferase [Treponema sp.]|jgi:2-C-methyl-D-erythritol 4-phosphate cytidylyltransferase|nr:2-C-methyl-D-erythritol 4-phosphate cytidylyltransferase [Treponema sp.]
MEGPAAQNAVPSSFAAVICAAGVSSRMRGPKKEYRSLSGAPDGSGKPLTVLGAVVSAFAVFPCIKTIVITVPVDPALGEAAARQALPEALFSGSSGGSGPKILFVPGGKTRRVSVHHALSLLDAYHPDYALIHDGARPWIGASLIGRIIEAAPQFRAVIPLLPLTETPKEIDAAAGGGGTAGVFFIKRHLRRANVGGAQTPQAFAFPEILRAHEKAAERECTEGFEYTDDAEVWGEFCGPVAVIPGEPGNKKITFPEDLTC